MARLKDIKTGVEIFEKYKGADAHCFDAEHDIFYGPEGGEVKEYDENDEVLTYYEPYDDDMKKLSDADKEALKKAHWFIDTETGHWAIFT